MKVRIGDILKTTEDAEIKSVLSDKKIVIPKGSEMIVRADNCVLYKQSGKIQFLGDDVEVEGYDIEGLASFITSMICGLFSMEELEEYFEVSRKDIEDRVEYALDELGF